MAVTFVGATKAAYAANLNSTFTIPPQAKAGDICLGFLACGSNANIGTATGWTMVADQAFGDMRSRLYKYEVAADSEAGTGTVFATTGPSGQAIKHVVNVVAYRGADFPLLDASKTAFTPSATSTTAHPAPTVTVSTAGTLLIQHYVDRLSTSVTKPAGVTERAFIAQGVQAGDIAAGTYDSGPFSSGTQGAGTYTGTNASLNAGVWTIRVNPDATPAPAPADPWVEVRVFSRP